MKIKYYLILVQIFAVFIAAFLSIGIVLSLIDGTKYSSLVTLLGAMIQGFCAIIVLIYAIIYHDDWKYEKEQWPKLTIEPICYKGNNDPTDEAIPLINGNNGIIYDCKIEIHNDREICNIYLKDKKYGILYYGISNKSCFSINHNITNINQYNIIHSNYISLVQNKEPSVHYLPIITKISIALTSEMSSLSYAFLFSCNENKCQKLIRCNQR